jgi:hypothetical protein
LFPIFCHETELFTGEDIELIPREYLISIDNYYFEIINFRKYLFDNKKEIYINPYTTLRISDKDLHKILNVNIKKLEFFNNKK